MNLYHGLELLAGKLPNGVIGLSVRKMKNIRYLRSSIQIYGSDALILYFSTKA